MNEKRCKKGEIPNLTPEELEIALKNAKFKGMLSKEAELIIARNYAKGLERLNLESLNKEEELENTYLIQIEPALDNQELQLVRENEVRNHIFRGSDITLPKLEEDESDVLGGVSYNLYSLLNDPELKPVYDEIHSRLSRLFNAENLDFLFELSLANQLGPKENTKALTFFAKLASQPVPRGSNMAKFVSQFGPRDRFEAINAVYNKFIIGKHEINISFDLKRRLNEILEGRPLDIHDFDPIVKEIAQLINGNLPSAKKPEIIPTLADRQIRLHHAKAKSEVTSAPQNTQSKPFLDKHTRSKTAHKINDKTKIPTKRDAA